MPKLETLDLAYNWLPSFDFDSFDQVGTLASLEVIVSYNKINELKDNSSNFNYNRDHGSIYHSYIKKLDLSHNNISSIQAGYFKPAEISLSHLSLSNNVLNSTTKDVFGNLPHLQWLDLSYNLITEVDYDSFKNTKKLQVLKIAHNSLMEIPADLFRMMQYLRVVDMSHNHLKSLPDNLFYDHPMESLDLSNNQLTKIPVTSLSSVAAYTLSEIDLSHNNIGAIHSMDLSNKFKSLSRLDLSNNRLVRLEDAAFATLPRLSFLDLSHNDELEVLGKAFLGLETSLFELILDNISLSSVPDLPLPFLRILRLSNNDLPSIPPELAVNMSYLRLLDLSQNDLTNVPLITHSLPQLRSLSLAGNPITTLTNTSLLGAADTLEYLDISNFNLNSFEAGALNKLMSLRSLKISTYSNINNFNIPRVLENVENLRDLWIESQMVSGGDGKTGLNKMLSTDLRKEMEGYFPLKLKNITFSGNGFSNLAANILEGIQTKSLHITLFNTSVASLPNNFFTNIGNAYNLSLDFRSNNNQLNKIPNPNTALIPNMPDNVFLIDLKIAGNSISCDCDIGWIEFWQRKRRQYMCAKQTWSSNTFIANTHETIHKNKYDCQNINDDIREALCSNKNNARLIEVLKADIECGWGSGVTRLQIGVALIGLTTLFTVWI